MAKISVAQLGRIVGASAQTVNKALCEMGFLSGVPGNYTITEIGRKFSVREFSIEERHFENTIKWDREVAGLVRITIQRMEAKKKTSQNTLR